MIKLFSKIYSECPSDLCRKLMDILKEKEFMNDPASISHHHVFKHGLVAHSYEVYRNLLELKEVNKLDVNDETLFLIAIGHDLDKVHQYKDNGDGTYGFVPHKKYGRTHGENSLYRLELYLGDELRNLPDYNLIKICICGHMGELEKNKKAVQYYKDNVDTCILLWLTHMADMHSCETNASDLMDYLIDEESSDKGE